jgi:fluoride ion exporter CrcB/FEX
MNILSKQSWKSLAQVAAAFTIIILLAVFCLDSPTAKEGVLMWSWGILGAFTALKLRTFPTKE